MAMHASISKPFLDELHARNDPERQSFPKP
jgi:hypothetical protein